jgi:hypothetical protein
VTLMTRTAGTRGPPPAFVSTPATSRGRVHRITHPLCRGRTASARATRPCTEERPTARFALCDLRAGASRWIRSGGGGGSAPSARSSGGAEERVVGRARLAVCEEEARTFDPDDATWERPRVRRGQRPGQDARGARRPVFFFFVL